MSIAAELHFNDFGGPHDQGLAALLAPPTAGVLPSLECIKYLSDNQIADEGCAALASALRGGAPPGQHCRLATSDGLEQAIAGA